MSDPPYAFDAPDADVIIRAPLQLVKQILLSSSFLEHDPILVYTIACRMNLDKEAKLTIPYTFNIDLIRDTPRSRLRMMTAEAYHHLLAQHSLRRDQLVNAVDDVCGLRDRPSHDVCRCVRQLKKEIRLQFFKPFPDRGMLEKCLSSVREVFPGFGCNAWACPLSSSREYGFLSDIMNRMYEI